MTVTSRMSLSLTVASSRMSLAAREVDALLLDGSR
jgi:hypothetical protein